MSNTPTPTPAGPTPQPGQPTHPAPAGSLPPAGMYRPPASGSAQGCFFALSVFLNLGLLLILVLGCMGLLFSGFGGSDSVGGSGLIEKTVSGSGPDKVAVVHFDGILLEGTLSYVHKQIEQAAKDSAVKAVVFRINSPGGSITSSDDLYRRLTDLRDGKKHAAKKLVVSMGSLAASGGYYIALPGQHIFAERTTLTGSIGVYASFPNVAGLAKDYKFGFITIKAGDIKDSGSMFQEMSDKEYAVWQSMISQAYTQFTDLVEQDRKGKLKVADTKVKFDYPIVKTGAATERALPEVVKRNLADGGIWTALEAHKYGLIDDIGSQDDAVALAKTLAGIPDNAKVVQYDKPKTLGEALLGVDARRPGIQGANLSRAATPRLWALMPGADLAGIFAALDE